MAGNYSSFLENKDLNYHWGKIAYTPPDNVYIALSTADPTNDGSGIAEPVGNGYARIGVDNDKVTFTTATVGTLSNAILITFAISTGAWGTITHWAIFDAITVGNMLAHGDLTTPQPIVVDNTVKIPIGVLVINQL